MKRALTYILTILLLPLTVPASVVIAALILAMLAILSPVLIAGGALLVAGKLSEKFTDWLYPPKNTMTANQGNGPVITSLSTTGILFFLLLAPIAVASAVTTAVVSVLFVPVMAVISAYKIADPTINFLYTALGFNKEEVPVKHSYSILPQDSDEHREAPEEGVPHHFDPLFQSNNSTSDNVTNRKALEAEKEIISSSESGLRSRAFSYSTSSDET